MRKTTSLIFLAVLISQTQPAPQLLTFKEGKIGVNFGGYHAGVGFGGLLGGNAGGGLFAEAGTPHGQSAIAGLGGAVSDNGGSSGGLYAGATAGNGIKASAGLAGGVNSESSAAGTGFASAQAGNNYAATGMEGAATLEGSAGYSITSTKDVVPVQSIEVKPIHTEINIDSVNEVQPEIEKKVIHENVQPVIVKEVSKSWSPSTEVLRPVKLIDFQDLFNSLCSAAFTAVYNQLPSLIFSKVYVAPKTTIVEKEVVHTHYKPHRHHFRKTAFLGGYVGAGSDVVQSPVVYKTIEPQIQKRIDVDAEASAHAGAVAGGSVNTGSSYTKQVTIQKNPSFFQDIFNIPISTLRAVGNFLGNTAANTHVSVQKSAQVQADSDSISSKNEPSSSSSRSSSSAQISVETPSASQLIDDIIAIPINTLTAVNKFLENNVPARKSVQIADDGTVEHSRVRLGPGRRRANKHVVIVEKEAPVASETEKQE